LLPGECQLNLLRTAAKKKRDAKVSFKPFDLMRQRRRRDIQTLRGARKMQFRRDSRKVTEVADFHRRIMRRALAKSHQAPCDALSQHKYR
jgi:hypothetical protein